MPQNTNQSFMKWTLVRKLNASLQEYHLMDDMDVCQAVLKYNPLHRSARLSCRNFQRLFFLDSAGALTHKTIFRNEYGMEVGSLSNDKWSSHEGSIRIDTQKYHYRLPDSATGNWAIYDTDPRSPLVCCGFQSGDNMQFSFASDLKDIEDRFLLLGLCWYLYLPAAKKNMVEYA